jgi:hypothetical protein
MDDLSLIFGIFGTSGVAVAIAFYIVSKGFKSKCLAAKMEMSLDIHQVKGSPKESPVAKPDSIGNMTRSELEIMIVDILHKHRHNSVTFVPNPVLPPVAKQPSFQEIEDMIKITLQEATGRSRSGSEESSRSHRSHHSHHSHHSKGKEEYRTTIREEL